MRRIGISDLFTRLYAYRQRETHDPLEDWLTECLAAALRSLSSDMLTALICEIFDQPPITITGAMSVVTQFPAGSAGRPDLVIAVDDRPWVVFENKVAHHVDAQLDRYGDWLASAAADTPWAGLLFVTHATPAPADFNRPVWDRRHAGKIGTGVTHWGRLGRKLLLLTEPGGPECIAHMLARSFYEMLESKQMADEFPNSQAFAALELFLGHGSPIENLVSRMWEQVCHAANSNKIGTRQLTPQPEFGCFSASRFVQRAPANQSGWSFLETGIWFADLNRWWDAGDLGGPVRGTHIFVLFANDEDDHVFDAVDGAPPGWARPGKQFFVHKALIEFPSEADGQAIAILDWCRTRGDELRQFLVSKQMTTFAGE